VSAGVPEGLAAVAAAFEPAVRPPADGLLYGPLAARVHGAPVLQLELAVELVYEGYLAHYRTSRLVPRSRGTQSLLLAGDYFYAHGLRLIAAGGDIGAVGLLARLMGACSMLRVEGLPPTVDDSLWEIAVSGVAAGEGSSLRHAARAAFSDVEAASRRRDAAAAAAAASRGLRTVRQVVEERPARDAGHVAVERRKRRTGAEGG